MFVLATEDNKYRCEINATFSARLELVLSGLPEEVTILEKVLWIKTGWSDYYDDYAFGGHNNAGHFKYGGWKPIRLHIRIVVRDVTD